MLNFEDIIKISSGIESLQKCVLCQRDADMQRTREKTARAEALVPDQVQCVQGTKELPEVKWQEMRLKRARARVGGLCEAWERLGFHLRIVGSQKGEQGSDRIQFPVYRHHSACYV